MESRELSGQLAPEAGALTGLGQGLGVGACLRSQGADSRSGLGPDQRKKGHPGIEGARGAQGLSVKRPYQPMLLLR